MNYILLSAVVLSMQTISVKFSNSDIKYTYLVTEEQYQSLNVGDYVVVPVRNSYTVAIVAELDEIANYDLEKQIEYKPIVCKLDINDYLKLVEKINDTSNQIKKHHQNKAKLAAIQSYIGEDFILKPLQPSVEVESVQVN